MTLLLLSNLLTPVILGHHHVSFLSESASEYQINTNGSKHAAKRFGIG